MKPCIIFLNGPENNEKRELVKSLKSMIVDNSCVAINRKDLINMFNCELPDRDESYEWIVAKVLKNILNNGVIVVFDAFLPTRRMQQYVQQMSGLPCYWIGVFFKEYSQDFYDYSVQLQGFDLSEIPFFDKIAAKVEVMDSIDSYNGLLPDNAAFQIYDFVENNEPKCFQAFKSVEFAARKRVIEKEVYTREPMYIKEPIYFESPEEKRAYKENKFRSLKNKYSTLEERAARENDEEGYMDPIESENYNMTNEKINNEKTGLFSKLFGKQDASEQDAIGQESYNNNQDQQDENDQDQIKQENDVDDEDIGVEEAGDDDFVEEVEFNASATKHGNRLNSVGQVHDQADGNYRPRCFVHKDSDAPQHDEEGEEKRPVDRHFRSADGRDVERQNRTRPAFGENRGGARSFGERRNESGDRSSGGGRSFGGGGGRSFGGGGGRSFGGGGGRSFGGDRSSSEGGGSSEGRRSFGGDRPFGSDRSSEGGRSFGDRPSGARSFGDRPSGRSFGGGRPFGSDRSSEGGRPSGARSFGDRSSEGGRPFGDRPSGARSFGDRSSGARSFGDRSSEGGRPFGDRPSGGRSFGGGGDRPGRSFGGDRSSEGGKPFGDRPSGGRSFGGGGDRPGRSFGGDRPSGRSFGGDRPSGGRSFGGDRQSGSRSSEGGRSEERKTFSKPVSNDEKGGEKE